MKTFRTRTALLLALQLAGCGGMPDINPPQESQAKLGRITREVNSVTDARLPDGDYRSGIWLAHRAPAPGQAQAQAQAQASLPEWKVSDRDKTLRRTLARWAGSAGWQLVWDLDIDYPIRAGGAVRGSFEQAMQSVLESMRDADVPLQAIFYQKNKVVRIVAKGAE